MSTLGTPDQPVRVAIIGSGPAGFYAADQLLKQSEWTVTVDMYDRLPTPYGLVRFGVAPDHEKIKNVTRVFNKVAAKEGFRFFGNVEMGKHVHLDDLQRHYHQICFATGAQTDKRMGIPGEDLAGSHPATEFVAWYNGHPDFRDYEFDLSSERVAVVGVGNVAVDVARMLCRTPEELETTDVAEHALEALRRSNVREVYMLGRRGPAQAAFTNPEIRELGELAGADTIVLPDEARLDPLSQAAVDEGTDRNVTKKVEIIQSLATAPTGRKPRLLTIRFLVSPVELIGNADGRVSSMRVVKNELYKADDGKLRPKATDQFEELPVDMVFRSVGYRGIAIPGMPFREDWGTVPHDRGRVVDPETDAPLPGLYVTGWIKRGPTGIIGTNKPDAVETVDHMLTDLASGDMLQPAETDPITVEHVVRDRQPDFVSYSDWLRIDEIETERGRALGRPRVKFTQVSEMLSALDAIDVTDR
jgi:ferredoxin--NADP+ reductase